MIDVTVERSSLSDLFVASDYFLLLWYICITSFTVGLSAVSVHFIIHLLDSLVSLSFSYFISVELLSIHDET